MDIFPFEQSHYVQSSFRLCSHYYCAAAQHSTMLMEKKLRLNASNRSWIIFFSHKKSDDAPAQIIIWPPTLSGVHLLKLRNWKLDSAFVKHAQYTPIIESFIDHVKSGLKPRDNKWLFVTTTIGSSAHSIWVFLTLKSKTYFGGCLIENKRKVGTVQLNQKDLKMLVLEKEKTLFIACSFHSSKGENEIEAEDL